MTVMRNEIRVENQDVDMTSMSEAEYTSTVLTEDQQRHAQPEGTCPPVARWAWSIPLAEFDWMDVHQPFVSLESL
ncbi:hypothetical protein A9R05_21875 [Burkholderia sp. KK1]|nr:hypothetical protein A9R05_21875 [Burkholderia sp. KK1]